MRRVGPGVDAAPAVREPGRALAGAADARLSARTSRAASSATCR
jgi:hypothetical protein